MTSTLERTATAETANSIASTTAADTCSPATFVRSGYAPVNGLDLYYEIHGAQSGETAPLVLIHGALSATGTSFGAVLPTLAQDRQVISLEMQAHGHTADADRPLTMVQLAEDTAAALWYLGIEKADVFGYSMGSAVALQLGIARPELVRKLVLAAVSYRVDGVHPGLLDGIQQLQPEHLAGTPWQEEYVRIAPRPEDFPVLVSRVKEMDGSLEDLPAEAIRSLQAPALVIVGDSDIVTPEHAVEIFRLLGGGVVGDMVGMPASQLAILPGAAHSTLMTHADLLLAMVPRFLDAPLKDETERA
jgi:pimeloyl-ACP methyl ester carboxylesterase